MDEVLYLKFRQHGELRSSLLGTSLPNSSTTSGATRFGAMVLGTAGTSLESRSCASADDCSPKSLRKTPSISTAAKRHEKECASFFFCTSMSSITEVATEVEDNIWQVLYSTPVATSVVLGSSTQLN